MELPTISDVPVVFVSFVPVVPGSFTCAASRRHYGLISHQLPAVCLQGLRLSLLVHHIPCSRDNKDIAPRQGRQDQMNPSLTLQENDGEEFSFPTRSANGRLSNNSQSRDTDQKNSAKRASRGKSFVGRGRSYGVSSEGGPSSFSSDTKGSGSGKVRPIQRFSPQQLSPVDSIFCYLKQNRGRMLNRVREESKQKRGESNNQEVASRSKYDPSLLDSEPLKNLPKSSSKHEDLDGTYLTTRSVGRTTERRWQSDRKKSQAEKLTNSKAFLQAKQETAQMKNESNKSDTASSSKDAIHRTHVHIDEESDGTVDPALVSLLRKKSVINARETESLTGSERNGRAPSFESVSSERPISAPRRNSERRKSSNSVACTAEPINALLNALRSSDAVSTDSFSEAHISGEKEATPWSKIAPMSETKGKEVYSKLFSVARSGGVASPVDGFSESSAAADMLRNGNLEQASRINKKPAPLRHSGVRARRPYLHSERTAAETKKRGARRISIKDFLSNGSVPARKSSRKVEECPTCEGSGLGECKGCKGDIWLGSDELGWTQCSACNGIGKGFCNDCGGSGKKGVWGFDRSEWKKIFSLPGLEITEDDALLEDMDFSHVEEDELLRENENLKVGNSKVADDWDFRDFEEEFDGLERYVGGESDDEDGENQDIIENNGKDDVLPDDLAYSIHEGSGDSAQSIAEFDYGLSEGIEDDIDFEQENEYEPLTTTPDIDIDEEEDFAEDDVNEEYSDDIVSARDGSVHNDDSDNSEETTQNDYGEEDALDETTENGYVGFKDYNVLSDDDLDETENDVYDEEFE